MSPKIAQVTTTDLPEPGIDRATVRTLDLNGLVVGIGIHVGDDERATRSIAAWAEGSRDGVDLNMRDAERLLAALPAFTEQVRALVDQLASGAR